jgi:hypothetical protein
MAVNYSASEFLTPEARDFFAQMSDEDWYSPAWQERYEAIIYEDGVKLNPPLTPFERELVRSKKIHQALYWMKADSTNVH